MTVDEIARGWIATLDQYRSMIDDNNEFAVKLDDLERKFVYSLAAVAREDNDQLRAVKLIWAHRAHAAILTHLGKAILQQYSDSDVEAA